jgi:hypothetical protein
MMPSAAFTALVAWQLYRLGREVYVEIQPLLASMQDTADTVRNTAGFVSERLYTREGVVGVAAGAVGLAQHVRDAYRDLKRTAGGPGRPPGPDAARRN